ncbi:LOW QUALITY PROTEIN: hypothetical protein Cgig2_026308 [Carnegiea gigantea]|uniref:Uncharacterized protein n=1 Tax=Carnegiea gigantea TaxID=171969 RepID=A0A9Q1QGP3_9CARY|nr:LOW QUALITY PROTEIN: hypothetical protein Cgig2_026308 [Carnegiea gigantea]
MISVERKVRAPSMKGVRESKGLGGGGGGGGGPPADLLVCFPSRARLALMPKPICSPVRPNSEPNKRHPHLKKINTTRGRPGGGGPVSPLLWATGKQMSGGGPDLSEPTSPKVTCAGQIKVGPRPGSSAATCRNWQSVMEEIERLHNSRSKHHTNNRKISRSKKSKHWGEALGFKKDIINFLTCLGNIRFDFRCFGSFPHPDITSDEEDDDEKQEEEDEDEEEDHDHDQDFSRETATDEMERNTVFSKWFMQNQDKMNYTDTNCTIAKQVEVDDEVQVPPPNALLLMRCRSAPAKRSNWPRVQGGGHPINGAESEDKHVYEEDQEQKEQQRAVLVEEKPKKKKRESLAIVMKYDVDFYNMASEVSKETWLVGDLQDALARSRSWKR